YFPDSDVLITMASMGYLERYCRTLAADMAKMTAPEEVLRHTWDVFCRYAFEFPDIFYHIFFAQHSVSLTEIIDDYYGLFPEQLHNISGPILDMMQEGPLSERSWKVLWPVAKERGITEQDARIINDMLVSYSRFLLEERLGESEGMLKSTELSGKLKTALSILI
ncbi:MAG: hypothetical protein IJI38_10085, partial [Clostridia bacterium]|nr:hypothetical protein [Clostridia bacterium]